MITIGKFLEIHNFCLSVCHGNSLSIVFGLLDTRGDIDHLTENTYENAAELMRVPDDTYQNASELGIPTRESIMYRKVYVNTRHIDPITYIRTHTNFIISIIFDIKNILFIIHNFSSYQLNGNLYYN